MSAPPSISLSACTTPTSTSIMTGINTGVVCVRGHFTTLTSEVYFLFCFFGPLHPTLLILAHSVTSVHWMYQLFIILIYKLILLPVTPPVLLRYQNSTLIIKLKIVKARLCSLIREGTPLCLLILKMDLRVHNLSS